MSEVPAQFLADAGQAEPSVAELLQEQLAGRAVTVEVNGPITTHELPSRQARYYTETVGTDIAHILYPDPKRKKGYLVSDTAFMVSHSSNAGSGGLWPANVPLPISHWSDVYAYATADTVDITVAVEIWAD